MKVYQAVWSCGLAGLLCVTAGNTFSQESNANPSDGRRDRHGNFDPAQFQQRMMQGVRERLAFTNDADWSAVQPLVQRVFDARREVGFGGMGVSHITFGRRGGETNAPAGGDSNRRSPFGERNPDAQALQAAIESNAPAAQLKDAVEKCRAGRKQKEDQLRQAQDQLRAVLSARQEAIAFMMGLVN